MQGIIHLWICHLLEQPIKTYPSKVNQWWDFDGIIETRLTVEQTGLDCSYSISLTVNLDVYSEVITLLSSEFVFIFCAASLNSLIWICTQDLHILHWSLQSCFTLGWSNSCVMQLLFITLRIELAIETILLSTTEI